MPSSRARRARRRVSSAATMSAVARVSRSRAEASARLPSGAPTRTSPPVMTALPRAGGVAGHPRSLRSPGDPGGGQANRDRLAPEPVRDRLARRLPADPYSWLATGVVVFVAAVLRFVGISHPRGKVFDEVYYATEGAELFQHGVEWRPESNTGDYVVHPPLGKWLIGLGELVLGQNETGWRISAAVAGVLSILIVPRIARRLFQSTVLGCAAGLLMALDGMHFVLSRSALLDIFLMLFVVAAFGCLVMDRDQRRRRWLRALDDGLDVNRSGPAGRPKLGVPGWRLAAGVMIGCG